MNTAFRFGYIIRILRHCCTTDMPSILDDNSVTPTPTSLVPNFIRSPSLSMGSPVFCVTTTSLDMSTSRSSSVVVPIATETRTGMSTLTPFALNTPTATSTTYSSMTWSSSSLTISVVPIAGAAGHHHHHAAAGTIVGAVIGGLVGLILVLLALFFIIRHYRRRRGAYFEGRGLNESDTPFGGAGLVPVQSRVGPQSANGINRNGAGPISVEWNEQDHPAVVSRAEHDTDDPTQVSAGRSLDNHGFDVPQSAIAWAHGRAPDQLSHESSLNQGVREPVRARDKSMSGLSLGNASEISAAPAAPALTDRTTPSRSVVIAACDLSHSLSVTSRSERAQHTGPPMVIGSPTEWATEALPQAVVEQEWQLTKASSAGMNRPPAKVTDIAQDLRFRDVLASAANEVRADPTTDLGTEANIRRLVRLAYHQPVIYCDDSGSMETPDCLTMTRFERLRQVVWHIARVANRLIPEDMGVHLRFINHPSSSDHDDLSATRARTIVNAVHPTGGTALGTELESRILQPLVYDVLDDPRGARLKRPLLVCTITDGAPTDRNRDAFKDAILRCKRRIVQAGYDSKTVIFSISHIGQDPEAVRFVGSLRRDKEIKDVIYCTSDSLDGRFDELQGNERGMEVWLLELLTNALMDIEHQ
ncbi:hypothetical protein PUNSTDRAFT_143447 [Punctularia strigosozonata HHB-11173 SS5]|uniref:uncharacterized protein n=1 Tax=Punctularia strigosozonata (strain HHB-11173) TaxID=741275 RepID=UPI00044165E8|nr:uncharacterized protein PUNSTDRAFT_143447 [Punctularia strigosozonata HHB-11173 SS5]EIN08708.1 hypothetical protein PUNSTDRAFT_143447 [Punctularia strigosozonata HHB-11173 SS5]